MGLQGNQGKGGMCYIATVGLDTRADLFDTSIGGTSSSNTRFSATKTALGIITDASKSGIVAKLNNMNIGKINSLKLGKYILKY